MQTASSRSPPSISAPTWSCRPPEPGSAPPSPLGVPSALWHCTQMGPHHCFERLPGAGRDKGMKKGDRKNE